MPLRGRLLLREPMARHTSWRVGGPADRLYLPADLDDLATFLKQLPENEPLYWVGLGSNLLVRDGGVRGTVIMTSGTLGGLALTGEAASGPSLARGPRLGPIGEGTVRAEAGVPCAKLARFSVQNGMRGGEFLAGIPGTVGGALAMNAGCHGSETWQFVEAVETLDRHGQLRRRETNEYRIAYRSVKGVADGTEARAAGQGRPACGLEGEWFVAGHFRFPFDDRKEGRGLIKRLLARRGATQPTQLPNAGSVFKNPPNDYAARLIEASGLKGACEGRACVSDLHANFIVNTGGARAADIERLIARVQAEVEAKQGVRLEAEVRVIGEAG